MREFRFHDRIEVRVGETFRVRKPDTTGGAVSEFIVTDDICLIGMTWEEAREPIRKFGAQTAVYGHFVCRMAGEHELGVRTGRPWEKGRSEESMKITCVEAA